MVFLVLKTARYVDSEEVVRDRRAAGVRRATTSSSPCATARPARFQERARPSRATRTGCATDPGAVLHAILDRVVDDYEPGDRRPRERHRRGRGAALLGRAHRTRPSASTGCSARCSSSGARRRRWSIRSTGWPRGHYEHVHPEIRDVLPRRERPPDPRPRPARRHARSAARQSCRPTSPRSACARTRTCARSRPGSRSSPCRRDGRHLRHELRAHAGAALDLGYPAVLLVMLLDLQLLYCRFKRAGWL